MSEYSAFLRKFDTIAKHKHRYDVFRDYVSMCAFALHNSINHVEQLEAEYMSIVGGYEKPDVNLLGELFGDLVKLMDGEPRDVLGRLYLDLNLGNDKAGQYFSPPGLSELMAQLTYGDLIEDLPQPFVTLSDPACGSGGLILAFVRMMVQKKINPSERLWVQVIDIDRLAALMAYVQLSLWHIPAEILVGNTLTMKMRERYYTPAHHLGGWKSKLQMHKAMESVFALLRNPEYSADSPESEADEVSPIQPPRKTELIDSDQFDFKF